MRNRREKKNNREVATVAKPVSHSLSFSLSISLSLFLFSLVTLDTRKLRCQCR